MKPKCSKKIRKSNNWGGLRNPPGGRPPLHEEIKKIQNTFSIYGALEGARGEAEQFVKDVLSGKRTDFDQASVLRVFEFYVKKLAPDSLLEGLMLQAAGNLNNQKPDDDPDLWPQNASSMEPQTAPATEMVAEEQPSPEV